MAMPSVQWLPCEQYSQIGSVLLIVIVKIVDEPPLEEGTKPE